ncbi:MAG: esterase/lipase family protein [Granulosicoccus sp.]
MTFLHLKALWCPVFRQCWLILSALAVGSCAIPLDVDKLVANRAPPGECAVLLHGLARDRSSMKPMQVALLRHGYRVVNQNYPSRHLPIQDLSTSVIPTAVKACREQGAERIHFVTHSLGGILIRQYLEDSDIPDVGRIVMLAPPNQGSEITDTYRNAPGFSLIFGPAGAQLGTDENSVPSNLGPIAVDTAIIAGTSTINLILSLSLPNPDDGKVSVQSTKLDGMCAHLLFPIAHPFIMKDARVISEVLAYLSTGTFSSPDSQYFICGANGDVWP